MKVRIKFTKEGPVKFVGHLDTMRYFQKAMRRAQLPVSYSTGFSPHMIMSFASPLGVGMESRGEYFDIDFKQSVPSQVIVDRLNAVMADGITVLSAVQVEEGKAGKAMSLVAACDYFVTFREGKEPVSDWKDRIQNFYSQKEIFVTKSTKNGDKEIDIRPFIYDLHLEDEKVFLSLASASGNYTRPDTVMDAFLDYLAIDAAPWSYQIMRLETYAEKGTEENHKFVPLEELGDVIE